MTFDVLRLMSLAKDFDTEISRPLKFMAGCWTEGQKTMKYNYPELDALDWSSIKPHVDALLAEELTHGNIRAWLQRWSDLESVLDEKVSWIHRAITENTADEKANERFKKLVQDVYPQWQVVEQKLKAKWMLVEDYEPDEETAQVYRRFKAEMDLFTEENIPIQTELQLRRKRYEEIIGGLSIEWKDESLTIPQAEALLGNRDRAVRKQVWRKIMDAHLAHRDELNELFMDLLAKRRQIAKNAGFPDYRSYAWISRGRFDYTPEDCIIFHDAIEQKVAPLTSEMHRYLAGEIGVDRLRPWETSIGSPWLPTVDPYEEPLQPFRDVVELEEAGQRVFTQVHPDFGGYFQSMRDGFLDLASRPNKAPGGYMNSFPISGRAYIFMNAVGSHRNFRTLMHEGGHAFHFFEAFQHQSLIWNYHSPMEFSEVASMSMEQLSMPYWRKEAGGVYDESDYRRAVREQLIGTITFLPYMAVVDKFQHWLYTKAPEDVSPADLDAKWAELWDRFLPGIDYSGLDAEKATGWHRKAHIFGVPFYYIEYGLAQIGALQVWRNALDDQEQAVADYRRALAAGYTKPLPELFQLANARFAFDPETVGELMDLIRVEMEKYF